MKRRFTKYPISASTGIVLSEEDKEQVLELAQDMLYQTHDNSPEYTIEEAYDSVLDHVIMVITEMDEDGMYSQQVKQSANYNNTDFTTMIRQCVEDHYDEYQWYADEM